MRRNLIPGLVLQAFALAIVLGYFQSPSLGAALDRVGALKAQYGYLYSALATALFGGLIPYLILLSTGRVARGRWHSELIFYVGLWTWKGMEVDGLYRLQDTLFGHDASPQSVVMKTLADQLLYNPLWAAPTQTLAYLWRDAGFSGQGVKAALEREPFLHRVIVVAFSSTVVWTPAVAIIYSLPASLQIPLFNLVVCFWSLLLSFISGPMQRHEA